MPPLGAIFLIVFCQKARGYGLAVPGQAQPEGTPPGRWDGLAEYLRGGDFGLLLLLVTLLNGLELLLWAGAVGAPLFLAVVWVVDRQQPRGQ